MALLIFKILEPVKERSPATVNTSPCAPPELAVKLPFNVKLPLIVPVVIPMVFVPLPERVRL